MIRRNSIRRCTVPGGFGAPGSFRRVPPEPVRPNPFRDSGTPEYSALTAAVRRLLDAVVDALALDAQHPHRRGARPRRRVSATSRPRARRSRATSTSGRLDGQRAPMPSVDLSAGRRRRVPRVGAVLERAHRAARNRARRLGRVRVRRGPRLVDRARGLPGHDGQAHDPLSQADAGRRAGRVPRASRRASRARSCTCTARSPPATPITAEADGLFVHFRDEATPCPSIRATNCRSRASAAQEG